jgi:siroheme synthase
VVRLASGDAPSRARIESEIAACRAAGIAVEVVPGVDAALHLSPEGRGRIAKRSG